ncbi:hypothetical protein J6590_019727 [Homalodisca vitripennis]|nr:hypothetical protein J6590_019727 [Homalodisca vitripennis]
MRDANRQLFHRATCIHSPPKAHVWIATERRNGLPDIKMTVRVPPQATIEQMSVTLRSVTRDIVFPCAKHTSIARQKQYSIQQERQDTSHYHVWIATERRNGLPDIKMTVIVPPQATIEQMSVTLRSVTRDIVFPCAKHKSIARQKQYSIQQERQDTSHYHVWIATERRNGLPGIKLTTIVPPQATIEQMNVTLRSVTRDILFPCAKHTSIARQKLFHG